MAEPVMVAFQGVGSGAGELTWGQRALWGGMQRQQTWMPMGIVLPLPDGSTLDGVAAELRFIMEHFPSMRTRLRLRPDGPPQQVLAASGTVALDVVDVPDGADPAAVADEVSRRLHDTPFDFELDWPLRTAVIRDRGVLTHQVTVVCHLVNDGFGGLVLAEELGRWHRGEPLTEPGSVMSPLEQAHWQGSPAGRRQSAAALRHWERTLRSIAPRRFPGPLDPRRPRYWQAGFTSRALYLAAQVVARRTGTDRTTVLLTAFAAGLADAIGMRPAVVRVIVNNRFRRPLAGSVSPVSQTALCVLDLADAPFDEAVARTAQGTLAAYKHAYYDPIDLDALVARVSRDRGEEIDIACYFNDRRPPNPVDGPAPSAPEIRAALPETAYHWMARQDRPHERMFITIENDPDTVRLDICGDTHHIPPAALEVIVRTMETVTVTAALAEARPPQPAASPARDAAQRTGHA